MESGIARYPKRILKVQCLKNLLKLQIDHVILNGHGEACPSMPKEGFKLKYFKKRLSLKIFIHSDGYLTTKITNPSLSLV